MPKEHEKKDNEGTLWKNKYKEENESAPDLSGYVMLGGEEKNVAVWKNKGRESGKTYYSLRISDKIEKDTVPF